MLEQKTIQQAAGLIERYGVLEGTLIYVVLLTIAFIAWNIFQNRMIHKKAYSPVEDLKEKVTALSLECKKLHNDVTAIAAKCTKETTRLELEHQKEVARIDLSIQERVRYEWAENHLIPKIEQLSKEVSNLSSHVQLQSKTQDAVAKSVDHLTQVLEAHTTRITELEHK